MSYIFASSLFDTPRKAAMSCAEEFLAGSGGAGGWNTIDEIEAALKIPTADLVSELAENWALPGATGIDDDLEDAAWLTLLAEAFDEIKAKGARGVFGGLR